MWERAVPARRSSDLVEEGNVNPADIGRVAGIKQPRETPIGSTLSRLRYRETGCVFRLRITHRIYGYVALHSRESSAFPGETGRRGMPLWNQYVSDHAGGALSDPDDARIGSKNRPSGL